MALDARVALTRVSAAGVALFNGGARAAFLLYRADSRVVVCNVGHHFRVSTTLVEAGGAAGAIALCRYGCRGTARSHLRWVSRVGAVVMRARV